MRAHAGNAAPARTKAFWILGLVALCLLAAVGFAREALRNRQIRHEIAALQAEAERLRARNYEIAELKTSLASPDFLEREARLKLGLRKEGERAVVLRKEEAAPAPGPALADAREAWSNPKKWLMYFADRHAFKDYAESAR
jgi:cell division protein FtsB